MNTPRILIVDDDPAIREVVRFALGRAGFATVEAADGQAALDRFAADGADLLVLDVTMPGLDGIDVCRALRRTSPVRRWTASWDWRSAATTTSPSRSAHGSWWPGSAPGQRTGSPRLVGLAAR